MEEKERFDRFQEELRELVAKYDIYLCGNYNGTISVLEAFGNPELGALTNRLNEKA